MCENFEQLKIIPVSFDMKKSRNRFEKKCKKFFVFI